MIATPCAWDLHGKGRDGEPERAWRSDCALRRYEGTDLLRCARVRRIPPLWSICFVRTLSIALQEELQLPTQRCRLDLVADHIGLIQYEGFRFRWQVIPLERNSS